MHPDPFPDAVSPALVLLRLYSCRSSDALHESICSCDEQMIEYGVHSVKELYEKENPKKFAQRISFIDPFVVDSRVNGFA